MEKGLKVLMIGSDRNLFVEGSAVSLRLAEYGTLVEDLHIVVMTSSSMGLKEKKIAPNVWIYPTNSLFKFLRPVDAARLGKKLVYKNRFVKGNSLITVQDPFECGFAGLMVKKRWQLPLEVQLHTDLFSPHFGRRLNALRKRLAKKILKQADSIRVVSHYLKDQLLKNHNFVDEKIISVLPICVDRERIGRGKVSFDVHERFGWQFVLLSVSRLTQEKNLQFALQVLARVREKFPSIGLVIVGNGPEEEALKAEAEKLLIKHNVVFALWQDDLGSFYATADAFLQTSLFEGYGLALVEAGLSGLPVITTPVGIAGELQRGRDAYIGEYSDKEYFARSIIELIENSSKRVELARNLKDKLENLLLSKSEYLERMRANWENTAKMLNQE